MWLRSIGLVVSPGSVGEVSMTEMASEALTAAAVETIARSGGPVAGRAGGHRPTLPRAPHDFADSARRLPDLSFVIDHLAKSRIAHGPADPGWEEAMAPFAELGHVACKVSGLVTEADWTSWRPADLAPYFAGWRAGSATSG
jgi:amidohydrolase family protein